jgi:hypothetical protein
MHGTGKILAPRPADHETMVVSCQIPNHQFQKKRRPETVPSGRCCELPSRNPTDFK